MSVSIRPFPAPFGVPWSQDPTFGLVITIGPPKELSDMDKNAAHAKCLDILAKLGVPANALWYHPEEMGIASAIKLYQQVGDAGFQDLFNQFTEAVRVLAGAPVPPPPAAEPAS